MIEIATFAPRTVYDVNGKPESIILDYHEYRALLRLLAHYADWNELPEPLQNAIDNVLADDAEEEGGNSEGLNTLQHSPATNLGGPPRAVASLYGAWANVEVTDEDVTEARLRIPDNLA